jgi:hypothetical protein
MIDLMPLDISSTITGEILEFWLLAITRVFWLLFGMYES